MTYIILKRPNFYYLSSSIYEASYITFDAEVVFDRTPVQGRDRLRRAQEITKFVAANFEKHISTHPDNWHQLQPVWPDLVFQEATS